MRLINEDMLFGFYPLKCLWKPLIKRAIVGSWKPLRMQPSMVTFPTGWKRLGLYLHIPFCRNLCPYCPYNRVEYDAAVYGRFETAVHQEIELVARNLTAAVEKSGGQRPQIVSLYIGGGTPTVEAAGLARLISSLQNTFGPAADVCVELHPAAMDDECLGTLKTAGVTMVSIGVESLSDRLLEMIGRSHDAATAEDAVRRAVLTGFDAVNVDLMFALPTQTVDELDYDLRRVLSLDVDQISTYPIFGFPYTELGRTLGIKAIRRPKGELIRRMLAQIRQRAYEQDFEQCAVWSFLKKQKKKFSSITRHHYLGFGPSAASMTGSQFYVNTFSVDQYIAALPGRMPVALAMPVDKRLEMAYWLYWRAYEMKISVKEFQELFEEDMGTVYESILRALTRLGMATQNNGNYCLTEQAAYWVHRIQNEYSLNYINRLWGRCREHPWPEQVIL